MPAEETASIYEAIGITGEFELSSIALIFSESPEDLGDLAANIEANGMLQELTLARVEGPDGPLEVVDGKRRRRACKIAGVQPTYKLLRDDIDPRAYVWAKNAMRSHLKPSQLALAFAELFPKRPPGRPPRLRDNCPNSDNIFSPTQGQGATNLRVGRELINQAYTVVDPHGRVAPEIREAIRAGTVSINDAASEKVASVSQDTQRLALSHVKDGSSSTISRAVDRLAKERMQRDSEPLSKLHPPTTLGKSAEFHCCYVDALKRRVKPGTVDLVLVHPPESVRIGFYSHIAEMADHVLSDAGVLVVAVLADALLRGILDRLSRKEREIEFIAEFSLLSPTPFTDLGDPHYTKIRRAALLVFGKRGARLPEGDDIIDVPAPARDMAEGEFMEINDGLPLAVWRFASPGQVVCIPTLQGSCGAVLAALGSGCTVIGADEDQSLIDEVVREASEPADDSSHDPESE